MAAPSSPLAAHLGEILNQGEASPAVERPRYIDAQVLRSRFMPAPSLRTIRSWTRARIIPSIKLGGRRYYDEAAVTGKIEARLTLLPCKGSSSTGS
jgi:hypothetical protein